MMMLQHTNCCMIHVLFINICYRWVCVISLYCWSLFINIVKFHRRSYLGNVRPLHQPCVVPSILLIIVHAEQILTNHLLTSRPSNCYSHKWGTTGQITISAMITKFAPATATHPLDWWKIFRKISFPSTSVWRWKQQTPKQFKSLKTRSWHFGTIQAIIHRVWKYSLIEWFNRAPFSNYLDYRDTL